MKHIKQFENFFTDLFSKNKLRSDFIKRKADGLYFWTQDEISALTSLGFYKYPNSSDNIPLFLNPEDNSIIKTISITKSATIEGGYEDYFFDLRIVLAKKDKVIFKSFDTITEVVDFIKEIIPEEDISMKKYNL